MSSRKTFYLGVRRTSCYNFVQQTLTIQEEYLGLCTSQHWDYLSMNLLEAVALIHSCYILVSLSLQVLVKCKNKTIEKWTPQKKVTQVNNL